MKSTQNVFCIRSPISSRPFYIVPGTDGNNVLSWVKGPSYHLSEPIDMQPFMPNFEKCDDEARNFSHSYSYTSKDRKYQNISPNFVNNPNEMPILQLTLPISSSFLCTPYFPFDLMLYDSVDDVAFAMYQKNQSKDKKMKRLTEDLQAMMRKDKKTKKSTDDFQNIAPIEKKPKRNTDDLFSATKVTANLDLPSSINPAALALSKNIKKFISSQAGDDYQYPNNIINSIIKYEDLLIECIYQLISLTNNTKSTMSVILSWKLMMLIVGYFPIPEPYSDYLRDYFIFASGHNEVDFEIQYCAKICLCRLFADHQLNIKSKLDDPNYKYIKASMSMTQLFGVTLGEVLVKEEYRRIRSSEYDNESYTQIKKESRDKKKHKRSSESNNNNQEANPLFSDDDDEENYYNGLNKIPESSLFSFKKKDDDEFLVPIILKKFIKAMLSLNALETVGIFRIPGEKAAEDRIAEDINNGNWEEPSATVSTLASITKRFVRELQDPLIPNYIVDVVTDKTPPYQIIQLINQLPSHYRETLMYLVGYFQQIADKHEINKMNTQNIIISLGTMFTMTETSSLSDFKSQNAKTNAVLTALLDHWNTSPVYNL